jgi:hypothetical protein
MYSHPAAAATVASSMLGFCTADIRLAFKQLLVQYYCWLLIIVHISIDFEL